MFKKRLIAVLALLAVLAGAWNLLAEDKDRNAKGKEVVAKGTKSESALTIDFGHSLGLPFDSLTTLGVRIEEARKAGDPVALANAATYLAAAEAASGKKAHLTSETLIKEAAEMAKERASSSELTAVAALLKGEDVVKDLPTLAEKAKKREADAEANVKAGERHRGIVGYVTAVNNTQFRIWVYEDSVPLGWVNPYDTFTFSKRLNHGTGHNSVLRGRSQDGSRSWGPVYVDYNVQNFTLTLD